ncbi:hypothetical protein LU298_03125 [Komagataeibacter intermedius]|uniref:hypothetical protein n=1 Tax=Komagataeibacter intermedius TaxID=66229 RepID=UPI000AA8B883|nr:hypothetical protein [Komagataeibacter intermedius]MCF3635494.1 hypothetical protein [Komagataeibacter intermedius]
MARHSTKKPPAPDISTPVMRTQGLFENNSLMGKIKIWGCRLFCKKLHQKHPLILKRYHGLTVQTVFTEGRFCQGDVQ